MVSSKNKAVKPPTAGSMIPTHNRRKTRYAVVGHRNVADPVLDDASGAQNVVIMQSNSSGVANTTICFAPLGIYGVNSSTFAQALFAAPHLPWLYNTSKNFDMYRITRAVLVVSSNLGSTATGDIAIFSSPDASDSATGPLAGVMTGGNNIAVAALAAKNWRVPLNIDTSWKKVSRTTIAANGSTLVASSTIDDLMLCQMNVAIAGAPPSANVCQFYIEYDVEFKGPVSIGANA